jgi:hypothetical protein
MGPSRRPQEPLQTIWPAFGPPKPLQLGQDSKWNLPISFARPGRRSSTLLDLARRLRSAYPDFDSEQFRFNLHSPDSIEREFFDTLNPGQEEFGELERILAFEGTEQALEYCIGRSWWPMALIFAHYLSEDDFSRTVRLYIQATFSAPNVLSATIMDLANNSDQIENWRIQLAIVLLNFENRGGQRLEDLCRSLERQDNREALAIVQVFLQPAVEGDRETGEEDGWFQGLIRRFRPKAREMVPPPPLCALDQGNWSVATHRAEMRRPRARYVNPF